jgi:AcrR family transcriptional regulator
LNEAAEPRRRGRRPGGTDTRAALLTAARHLFVEQGYEKATVRSIASRAGVDPAMVNHWFGGKDNLFAAAVLELPFDPVQIIGDLSAGPPDEIGDRVVRRFLTIWDATGGGQFAALLRSVTSHEQAAATLRGIFINHIFGPLMEQAGVDQPMLRANLFASQVVGLGIVRYVVKFEPLASADADTVARAVAPTLQRYFNGPID